MKRSCSICGNTFDHKGKVDSGQYLCPECRKRYRQSGYMLARLRTNQRILKDLRKQMP